MIRTFILLLCAGLLLSPPVYSQIPSDPAEPAWLKENCTRMGGGSGASGMPPEINAVAHWVSMTYQCKKDPKAVTRGPEGHYDDHSRDEKKRISAMVETYGKAVAFKGAKADACEIIFSSGSLSDLTSKPGAEKHWEHVTDFFLVQYQAAFLCRKEKQN